MTKRTDTNEADVTANTGTDTSQPTGTPAIEPKPHYATRDFNDAGTERRFTANEKIEDVEAGSLANYVAAGLGTTDRPAA